MEVAVADTIGARKKTMKFFRARFNQSQETPDADLKPNPVRRYASCECLTPQYAETSNWQELGIHADIQNTESEAWKSLEAYLQRIESEENDEFNLLAGIGAEYVEQIVALPRSIGKLKSVKFLCLYGSRVVRIPPEIGEMTNLEEFDPYTSYSLHWFPYELTAIN